MTKAREPLDLPPEQAVVPVDVARAVVDEVTATVEALEEELARLRAEADEIEARARAVPFVDRAEGVGAELLQGAVEVVEAARAYASRVVEEARISAQEIVAAAEREAGGQGLDGDGASRSSILRLAPVDRSAP